MPARKEIAPGLLARARQGELTRKTASTAEERSAVYRVEHEAQETRRRRGETRREALGHPRGQSTLPSISAFVDQPPRYVVLENVSRRDAARLGRYDNLVRQLQEGKITGPAFRRRVRRWRPVAGQKLLADPGEVVALVELLRVEDREVFYYESGRAA